ncbi:hypothetical protein [Streptacidiphilus sp. EB103A]|uniref:hypothetical protein n=1 Tax=Streptacidiphilus sp. EB103A TaxID=3156275 RepID=UPI003516A7D2
MSLRAASAVFDESDLIGDAGLVLVPWPASWKRSVTVAAATVLFALARRARVAAAGA